MKASVLELGNLIQGFKLSCQTEGKSPKTIEWYTTFLRRFLAFLLLSNYPTDAAQINKEVIRAFILYLQKEAKTPRSNEPLSPATVQGYVRTLKVFFSWMVKEDYLADSPTAKIPVPKAPVKVINTFSHEQIGELAQACYKSNGNGYRNLTILLLLLDSGIRVSELVHIDLTDINQAEGWIKISKGKGSKERVVPVGSVVQKSLWKYINHHRSQPLTQKVTRLFLSDDGLPLTRSGIQQMLRRCGKRACISGVRCSPHTFRHTFAKSYLVNGGDIFSLQKILGHSSLASVRVYLNLFGTDIKKQHQKYSPADNLANEPMVLPLIKLTASSNTLKGI
ncbi:tyrosine-type recombinase/integrase [Chloroflexota bacterium]